MECDNNDPIFLAKNKTKENPSGIIIPSDSKATGKRKPYWTSGTSSDSATFRREIIHYFMKLYL